MPDMDAGNWLASGIAAVLFAAVFIAGARVHPMRALFRDRRTIVSFCAGMSIAYVFVHVMPELHGARAAFAESLDSRLRSAGMAIYVLSLFGFLVFYGLDHLRARRRKPAGLDEAEGYGMHVGGFAAYVLLVSYLLVHNLEEAPAPLAAYVIAMLGHFLAVDHSLRDEYGAAFDSTGRFVLAGAAIAGWGIGMFIALPPYLLALLVAFVSGAVIMNSAIMELPTEKDGRFWPFMIGGLAYGLLLVPLG